MKKTDPTSYRTVLPYEWRRSTYDLSTLNSLPPYLLDKNNSNQAPAFSSHSTPQSATLRTSATFYGPQSPSSESHVGGAPLFGLFRVPIPTGLRTSLSPGACPRSAFPPDPTPEHLSCKHQHPSARFDSQRGLRRSAVRYSKVQLVCFQERIQSLLRASLSVSLCPELLASTHNLALAQGRTIHDNICTPFQSPGFLVLCSPVSDTFLCQVRAERHASASFRGLRFGKDWSTSIAIVESTRVLQFPRGSIAQCRSSGVQIIKSPCQGVIGNIFFHSLCIERIGDSADPTHVLQLVSSMLISRLSAAVLLELTLT